MWLVKDFRPEFQKIVVLKCSPWRENGVHLQRISALKCPFLSPSRCRVFSIGFIRLIFKFSNRVKHAHNLCWRRILKKAFDKCEISRLWRTRKSNFFPSFKLFSINFVTFSCNVVGQAFDNVDFVVNIEEKCCHLEYPVLTLYQDWVWIFEESFNERLMWWSRSTNESCYLFIIGWDRNYSEFFSVVVEDDSHNYLVLVVNIQ